MEEFEKFGQKKYPKFNEEKNMKFSFFKFEEKILEIIEENDGNLAVAFFVIFGIRFSFCMILSLIGYEIYELISK